MQAEGPNQVAVLMLTCRRGTQRGCGLDHPASTQVKVKGYLPAAGLHLPC